MSRYDSVAVPYVHGPAGHSGIGSIAVRPVLFLEMAVVERLERLLVGGKGFVDSLVLGCSTAHLSIMSW